ncbi:MAG TPA: thrombospondin type 3 repeat-containing protein [Candidatus Saccharimonadales bacterium]|nr:thrombospondin type 3 repeat-containing protein [Candidatus Saccharimonadales bacterium]
MLGKTNKKTNVDEATVAKVNQELIVHNMPTRSFAKISPTATISGSQFLTARNKKNNHQTVGIVIVSLGIIFVGVLIYLSYRFIIKPVAQAPVVTAPSVVTQAPAVVAPKTPPLVATSTASTTMVVEIEPSVIDLINNSDTAVSTTSTASSTIEEAPIIETPPLLDTDFDGLSDDEEIALGTDSSLPDSDGDDYDDLSELGNSYNPSGSGKLSDSSYLTKYQNQTGKYEIYYPASWTLKSLNNDYAAIISAPDNSLMQISVQGNPSYQNISSWYGATFPTETISSDRLQKGTGWEGTMGEDGFNFYLTDNNRENIYIISYIPALSDRLAYPNIFKMIINSFQIN